VLSNVSIVDLGQIPENAPNVFPGISGATTEQKQALAGMIVWNTNDCLAPKGDGLYVWDGSKWNYTGGSDGNYFCVTVPAPQCMPIAVPAVTFMAYNLGADAAKLNADYPGLSPAKQQMAYQANNTFSETDATVYGDLYQWGRRADGHEKRNNSLIYSGPLNPSDVEVTNGQPKALTGQGRFITVPNGTNNNDWSNPQNNTLWGNGQLINYNFGSDDGGAVPGSGGYYQKPVKTVNDPCPDGWRVPTQDEWERLTDYGCGAPQTAGGSFAINTSTECQSLSDGLSNSSTNAPLTWVRVKDGKALSGEWEFGDLVGYAIYRTSDWTAAATGYKDGTNNLYDDTAPEPLLFLPTNGYRYRVTGMLDNFGLVELNGHYWSSTVTNNSSLILQLRHDNVNAAYTTAGRAHGLGVRCVKE
ncbi:MAG: hypothetical protein LBS16_04095, partial [Prevotellaceae bacterium]|jgi:uncharacterized protein (TIGR02145 family)|nr:hypothetical protein [Prevotellaceae bacterium]